MGRRCSFGVMESSGTRSWKWLHDTMKVLNTIELYTLKIV